MFYYIKEDHRYITIDRLNPKETSVSELIAFLYFEFDLKRTFNGSGCMVSYSGENYLTQYIIPNVTIERCEEVKIINLEI